MFCLVHELLTYLVPQFGLFGNHENEGNELTYGCQRGILFKEDILSPETLDSRLSFSILHRLRGSRERQWSTVLNPALSSLLRDLGLDSSSSQFLYIFIFFSSIPYFYGIFEDIKYLE